MPPRASLSSFWSCVPVHRLEADVLGGLHVCLHVLLMRACRGRGVRAQAKPRREPGSLLAPRGSSAGGSRPRCDSTASRALAATAVCGEMGSVVRRTRVGVCGASQEWGDGGKRTLAISSLTSFWRTAWSRRSTLDTGSLPLTLSSAGASGYASCAGPPIVAVSTSPGRLPLTPTHRAAGQRDAGPGHGAPARKAPADSSRVAGGGAAGGNSCAFAALLLLGGSYTGCK